MEKDSNQVRFDRQLHDFLTMAIEVWPTFQSALKHLSDIGEVPANSFVPQKNYTQMQEEQFVKTIIQDLFDFIMNHDVKAQDIEDYLDDILELMRVDEELIGGNANPASTHYMSNYTCQVMDELQKGSKERVEHFRTFIYSNVKMFKGQTVVKQEGDSEEEGEQDEDEQYEDEQEEIEEKKEKKQEKSEEEKLREQELQDDGWTIVRK